MIYKAKLAQSVLLNMNKKEQQIENSISNKIWTLQIHHHAVWTEECIDHLSIIDQQHSTKISKYLCDYVSEQYFDIFQHTWKALWTYTESIEKTWQTDLVYQQEKELIWNTESKLSKICHIIRQYHSELTKNKDSYELTKIHETKESTDFFRSDELLLTICHTTFLYSRTLDMFYI